VVVPAVAVFGLVLVALVRRYDRATKAAAGSREGCPMIPRKARAFLAFWYDFIVATNWRIAVGVIVALVLTYAISAMSIARGGSFRWRSCAAPDDPVGVCPASLSAAMG